MALIKAKGKVCAKQIRHTQQTLQKLLFSRNFASTKENFIA
jgi:hypothetical protein